MSKRGFDEDKLNLQGLSGLQVEILCLGRAGYTQNKWMRYVRTG